MKEQTSSEKKFNCGERSVLSPSAQEREEAATLTNDQQRRRGKETREVRRLVYLTKAEFEVLTQKADKAGLSFSRLLVDAALQSRIRPAAALPSLEELLAGDGGELE